MSSRLVTALLAPSVRHDVVVHLVGGPYVTCGGERHEVPDSAQRLVAFLALRKGPVSRRVAAGTLWPDGRDGRAGGNLRSATWRLRTAGLDILAGNGAYLALRAGAVVDIEVVGRWATRVIDDAGTSHLTPATWAFDVVDLLPGWDDDWVVFERELLRQRLLHAFEHAARRLAEGGRYAEAVEAAMAAVAAEPLRESATRLLIQVHLAEGNVNEARRVFDRYVVQLRHELDLPPSSRLCAMLGRRDPGPLRS